MRNAGIPAYGHSGLADDVDDFRAHGKDERVPTQSFFEGQEYLYGLSRCLRAGGRLPSPSCESGASARTRILAQASPHELAP